MNKQTNDIDLIESFLEGGLSANEQVEFNNKLKTDKAFNELYQFRVKIDAKWRGAMEFELTGKRIGQIIRKHKKSKQRKVFLYSAAAVLIAIITIPGAILLNQRHKSIQFAESETYQLQIDIPESKATLNYYDEEYKQLKPEHEELFFFGDTILFRWETALDVETAIIIKERGTDMPEWRIPVKSHFRKYETDMQLPPGSYIWKLEGFEGEMVFSIRPVK